MARKTDKPATDPIFAELRAENSLLMERRAAECRRADIAEEKLRLAASLLHQAARLLEVSAADQPFVSEIDVPF